MKCTKCGAELEIGTLFCQECGTKVEAVEQQPIQEEKPKMEVSKASVKNAFNTLPKNGKIGVSAVAAVIVIFILSSVFGKKSINLNKFVTVEFTGYETVGKAHVEFDYEGFDKAFGKKLKLKKTDDVSSAMLEAFIESSADVVELMCLEIADLDVESGLSNGDEVKLTWNIEEEELKELNKAFNYKFKFKDFTTKVSGLEEVELVDPFEGVEVIFSGVAPNGRAEVVSSSFNPENYALAYMVEPSGELSNGDKVKVTLGGLSSEAIEQYFAEEYGLVPSVTEKEFTVEGLGKYVTESAEISEETIEKMKSQVEDILNAKVANDWSENASIVGVDYLGNYFLTLKESERSSDGRNLIWMVYQVTANVTDAEEGVDDTFTYFYTIGFNDLIILPDGTCSVDLSNYSLPRHNFTRSYDSVSWFAGRYTFNGYEDLDSLLNDNVTARIDRYTYENNVTVPEEPAEEEAPAEE